MDHASDLVSNWSLAEVLNRRIVRELKRNQSNYPKPYLAGMYVAHAHQLTTKGFVSLVNYEAAGLSRMHFYHSRA